MTAPAPHRPPEGLTHQGLVYGSDEEFLAATVPFCREGLARGEAVLAVTTGTNIGLLRRALDDVSGQVEYADAQDWYQRPGATLGAYHRWVDRRTAGGAHRRVRVIGEPVWHGRDALETAEWTRYESAVNVAFADCPAWIICPYDTRVLPPAVVADAHRTHPELATDGAAVASDHYADPADADSVWSRPLAPVGAEGEDAVLSFGADLTDVRTFVADTATALGLAPHRTPTLVFAVNEVATNAVQHGGGAGRLVLRRCGPRIVADVVSTGPSHAAWYLGYLPPDPRQPRGHGMWAVRHLCDLLEVHTDDGATTVRLHVGLD
ncbi:anti-sigma factor RsbA family regulatory protein [Streptomyces galbus]|uniref:anti-sigma factor RsbA family regulatory protein n=1 Tax=Streptomyces galbus TaxID=33898 RepID=UPI0037B08EFE